MIVDIQNGQSHIKSEWTPKYYNRFSLIVLFVSSPFLLFFPVASVYLISSEVRNIIFLLAMLLIFSLFIVKTKKMYDKKKVSELLIDDKSLTLYFFTWSNRIQTITLPKEEVKVTFKIIHGPKSHTENIEIEDKNQNLYYLMSQHGLWRIDDTRNIFSIFESLKYKRRKLE